MWLETTQKESENYGLHRIGGTWISSDRDDWMRAEIKTPENSWTKI